MLQPYYCFIIASHYLNITRLFLDFFTSVVSSGCSLAETQTDSSSESSMRDLFPSLPAQRPSVESSVPGSVCQSEAPGQHHLLSQPSAFLPQQTPHCPLGLHVRARHVRPEQTTAERFMCVTERRRRSLFTATEAPLCCAMYVFGEGCLGWCSEQSPSWI